MQITIDNRGLQRVLVQSMQGKRAKMEAAQIRVEEETPKEEIPVKGQRYVPIPAKYYAPDTSPLTYEVTPGPQTHDIVLD